MTVTRFADPMSEHREQAAPSGGEAGAGEATTPPASNSGRRAALRSLGATVVGLFTVRSLGESAHAQGEKNNENNGVDAEHRRRRRRRRAKVNSTIVAGNVASLPTPGLNSTSSTATCASNSALLGCAFDVTTNGAGTEPTRALKDTIADVVPTSLTCTATLTRVDPNSPPGSVTAVAQIQAFAICRA